MEETIRHTSDSEERVPDSLQGQRSGGRHTLPKSERLHGQRDISSLLNNARYGCSSMLRYGYSIGNGHSYSRIMISVPKRFFKRAVKRNLLKRRLRESYRLQKSIVEGRGADIIFIYNSKKAAPFSEIYSAVGEILLKISEKNAQRIV